MNVEGDHRQLNLLDLPNEILLTIVGYLPMIDAMYSFVNISQRLDQLVLNPISTRTLKMICLRLDLLPARVHALDQRALATLCRIGLPRIRAPINQLIVDQFAIDDVLRTREYFELRSLSLVDIDEPDALDILRGNAVLCKLFNEQITTLVIDMKYNYADKLPAQHRSTIFHWLLQSCPRLTKFHFCSSDYASGCRRVEFSPLNCQSALLTDLKVSTTSFRECLYLFEGHFPALSTLTIEVGDIGHTPCERKEQTSLHNLKRFSLISYTRTCHFDLLIAPFLRRLINLEELSLCLAVIRSDSNYLDGVQLRDDVLRYLPRLNKFDFSIETTIIRNRDDLILSSIDDIQRSFMGGPFGAVGAQVDVYAKASGSRAHKCSLSHHFYSRCLIYSLPYKFADFPFPSNSFQKGTFEAVRVVCAADVRPFEHEFFRTISQSFPLLSTLYIFNDMPQASQGRARTAITFHQLRGLDIRKAHVDYARQFLIDEHCHLPRLHELQISWTSLMSATNDFTNAATRLTCSRVKDLRVNEPFVRPEHFHEYFSSL